MIARMVSPGVAAASIAPDRATRRSNRGGARNKELPSRKQRHDGKLPSDGDDDLCVVNARATVLFRTPRHGSEQCESSQGHHDRAEVPCCPENIASTRDKVSDDY